MDAKKTIYLIRHGETDHNRKGIIQGSGVDAPLNATGLQQARLFHQAYRHIPFDRIYSSELQRARSSILPFVQDGIPFESLPEFNEISWGVLEGLPLNRELERLYKTMLSNWRNGLLDCCVEGGESPNDLLKRQQEGLSLLDQRVDERTILLCMHGRSMRSFLCLLTKTPLTYMDDFPHSNLCLYILEKDTDRYRIVESNSTVHL